MTEAPDRDPRHDEREDEDGRTDQDGDAEKAPSPLEGLMNPEEGANSPASDADVQPPG